MTTSLKPSRRLLLLAAVGLTMTASACSSDDGDSAVDGTSAENSDGASVGSEPVPPNDVSDSATPGATTVTPTDAPPADAPTEAPAAAVPAALQFTAPLLGGGEFDGAAYAGTPTVFWFWAPT